MDSFDKLHKLLKNYTESDCDAFASVFVNMITSTIANKHTQAPERNVHAPLTSYTGIVTPNSIPANNGPSTLPRLSNEALKPLEIPWPTFDFCVINDVTQGLIKELPMPNRHK